MPDDRSRKAPQRKRRITTVALIGALLLAVGVAAYAYAAGGNGGKQLSGCGHVEIGVSNCVVIHSVHSAGGGKQRATTRMERAVARVRSQAATPATPVDCNGACPETQSAAFAQAVRTESAPNGTSTDPGRPASVVLPAEVQTACPLDGRGTATVAMFVPACLLSANDLASTESPLSFWGKIDCAAESRYAFVRGGGDPHLGATGEPSDGNYRRVTVLDGDEDSGERCELGENSTEGPTAFYHEGEEVLTYYSERLPSNFPLDASNWQVTMQMKQAQPSHDDGSGVALEMEAREGRWIVSDLWHEVFSFPAKSNAWTRFAWDVYYSNDPNKGWVQVSADLNGDGDFNDPGERSPVIHAATMATELPEYAAADGIPAGTGIPSHLRMGIYHDPSIACPAPDGCSVDIDNVQILRPAP